MENFKERQVSWIIITISIMFTFFLIYAYIYQIGNKPVTLPVVIILLPLILFTFSLFYEMRTVVYNDRIEIKYGFGIIKKVFYLKDLTAGDMKRIPWWYGAGIKFYSQGILYSINFTNATEFKLKDQNKYISIGSKTPELLAYSVNKAIEKIQSLHD